MALFVLPLMIGLILLGRKLYTLYLNQRDFIEQPYSRAVVWDSSAPAKVIGPVVGYDQFEAPLVIFRDATTTIANPSPPPATLPTNGGVVLGVRRFRFTSYGQVFYTNSACTANPRIRSWTAPFGTGPNLGSAVVPLYPYPPVGFAYQMQQVSYAVGNSNILYSATSNLGGLPVTSNGANLWVWTSQTVAPALGGPPTPPCFLVPAGQTVQNLVLAVNVTPVIALGDLVVPGYYTPPFQLAFPTPSATPLPPLPTCPGAEGCPP